MIWAMQYFSLFPGGLSWAAAEIAPDEVDREWRQLWLSKLCLDPASNDELRPVVPRLRHLVDNYTRQKSEGVAVTEIGREIYSALDYCNLARCLVVISGAARRGKTFAAQRWVELNPGRARYCEVPASADDTSFMMALARSLGITIESNAKRKNLQPRIEAALVDGDITLILDQAAQLWPSHNYRKHSRPARICFVMEMVNRGASIALLITPNFFSFQQDYMEKSRWIDSEWWGRVSKFIQLPETLPIGELEKVARAWLPHGDRRSIEALADAANLSKKYLAAIEHTVKQANHFAQKEGRDKAAWPDIYRAIKCGVLPSDEDLALAIHRAGVRRKASAALTR